MRPIRRTLASLIVFGSLALSLPALAVDVDLLFAQGNAALEAGKHEEALRAFEAVWQARKTYDVAANLAQAETQLGKHRDAAEHLAYALRNFPVSGKPALRKQIEELAAEAKKQVVTLRVRVNVDKADVSVNGKPVGTAPIAEELFADSGTVTVEAGLDGYDAAKQTLEMKKGEARDVVLTLVPNQTPPGRSIVAPAIAFGVGGAGLVLGVVAGAVTASGNESLSKKCDPSGTCPKASRDELDRTLAVSRASTAGFVIAGVGAAVGVTLLLLPGKRAAQPRATLLMSPAFVGVKGTF